MIAQAHTVTIPEIDFSQVRLFFIAIRGSDTNNEVKLDFMARVANASTDTIDHHHEPVNGIIDSFLSRSTCFVGQRGIDSFPRILPNILEDDETGGVLQPEF